MQHVKEEDVPSFSIIKKLVAEFKRRRTSVKDDLRSVRLKTASTKEIFEKVYDLILGD